MEKNLHTALENVLGKPGVSGILCADENGLCLASKGGVDRSSSGSLVHLIQLAKKLEPSKIPTLKLETESTDILLRCEDRLTLAIIKSNKK